MKPELSEQPTAYIWRCANGHECAVSELEWTEAIIQPTCKRPLIGARGRLCGADLLKKLRPFPEPEKTHESRR